MKKILPDTNFYELMLKYLEIEKISPNFIGFEALKNPLDFWGTKNSLCGFCSEFKKLLRGVKFD